LLHFAAFGSGGLFHLKVGESSMRFAAALGTVGTLLALAACNGEAGDSLIQAPGTANLGDYSITGGAGNADVGVEPKLLIGAKMVAFLDGDDQGAAAMAAAQAAALPMGQKVTWQRTTDVGQKTAAGFATPIGAPYQETSGRTCRFVQESATRGHDSVSDAVKICNSSAGWVPA
jgi:hypothetical protein